MRTVEMEMELFFNELKNYNNKDFRTALYRVYTFLELYWKDKCRYT